MKNKIKYIYEINDDILIGYDNKYEFCKDISNISGDIFYISNLNDSISRYMLVESPYKYVEFSLKKQMQDSGEFSEPVTIISHIKKKNTTTSTEILFTALPARLHHYYFDKIKNYNDCFIFFPLYSALLKIFNSIASSKPTTLIFQYNRFAEIIIGTKQKIIYANRCMAFDESKEQILSLWDACRTDIAAAENDNKIINEKIFILTWINSDVSYNWPEDYKYKISYLPEETITIDNKEYKSSFIALIKSLKPHDSASPISEKIFYISKKFLPFINITFLFLSIVCIILYFSINDINLVQKKKINQLKNKISSTKVQHLPELPKDKYEKSKLFINEILDVSSYPSFKELLGDVSNAIDLDSGIYIESIKMNYNAKTVCIELFGNIKTSFEIAHNNYQNFIKKMKKKKYIVKLNNFHTNIKSSEFLIKFEKNISSH